MTVLRIKHQTIYSFESGVSLNPHRLLLRPREGRELRLLSHLITIAPANEEHGRRTSSAMLWPW